MVVSEKNGTGVTSNDYVVRARRIIDNCDNDQAGFSTIHKEFDTPFSALLHEVLHLPLVRPIEETVAPSQCCNPAVTALRTEIIEKHDDVAYFVFNLAIKLIKEEAGGGRVPHVQQRALLKRKRQREEDQVEDGALANGDCAAPSLLAFVANVFTLLYALPLPDPDAVRLRWPALLKEKARVEKSASFLNSNMGERRAMQTSTALCIFSAKSHKHMFSALWTAYFTLPLPSALQLHLLTSLGSVIIPNLSNPLTLADYLTLCYSGGGLVAVLALQGIFLLMLDHGLEYPAFYQQLYSLITPDSFSTRHRYHLFRLVDACLSSLRVPAYVVAAFIKRTAQVALLAPLPTLYFSLPFLRKLFQRHPNCLALIHRRSSELARQLEAVASGEGSKEGADAEEPMTESAREERRQRLIKLFDGEDPYVATEGDLIKVHAIDSSLWELCLLERHFLPAVSLMVSAFASPAEDPTPLKFEKSYARLIAHELTLKTRPNAIPTVVPTRPSENILPNDRKAEPGISGIFTF